LRTREYLESNSPVWATCEGEKRLLYSGLWSIVRRRAKQADINQPQLHDFRRTFALEAHRSNMPILIISKLVGHNQLTTTTRYLRLDENDLRESYTEKNLFG
jgi:integrase